MFTLLQTLGFPGSSVIKNLVFPSGSVVKNLPANAGDAGLTPGSGRPLGERNGNPLESSYWEIPWTEEPGGLQSMGSQKNQI